MYLPPGLKVHRRVGTKLEIPFHDHVISLGLAKRPKLKLDQSRLLTFTAPEYLGTPILAVCTPFTANLLVVFTFVQLAIREYAQRIGSLRKLVVRIRIDPCEFDLLLFHYGWQDHAHEL